MINETELIFYLEAIAEKYPNHVIERLGKGSKVSKSLGWTYNIDNVDLDKKLGDFPEGVVPYGPIHRGLRNSQKDIVSLFSGSSEINFSKVNELGIGECLEKAILVQLSAQRGRKSFLINGALTLDNDFAEAHAYNVIFKDGKPFLIDAENPLAKDSFGKITHPYIAPIIGIKENDSDFMVPSEWKQGRTYSIF